MTDDIPEDVMAVAWEVVESNDQWHIADSDTSGGWEDKTEEAAIAIARAILAERERCVGLAKKHASARIGGVTMDVHTLARTPREIDAAKAANEVMRWVLTALADEMAGIPSDGAQTMEDLDG